MIRLANYLLILGLALALAACGTSTKRPAENGSERAAGINARLGAGYLAQGELELAKKKLDKALAQDPRSAEAHAAYGLLQSRLGQAEQAEKHFKKALKYGPGNSETLNNYGTFLCSQGRIEEAEQQFLAALKDPLYQTPQYAYTNAARCSMKLPDYAKAELYLKKALKQAPRFPNALYQMAVLNNKQGNNRLAKAYMDKFDEYGRHSADSLWLAIRLARYVGDKDAEASYTLLLKNQFPDSKEAGYLSAN